MHGTNFFDIKPGPGVTSISRISHYGASLAGTAADSFVYRLDSGKPGPTVFVAAGTHANEIAGIMAAILLVERAQPCAGTLIVLPQANASGSTYRSDPAAEPQWLTLSTPKGMRSFAIGARLVSPLHQTEADPGLFQHSPGMIAQLGSEARNLDRAYPGTPDGSLTARLAWAILTLIITEKVDVAFDLHEARPSSGLAWSVIANPKNLETAALALFDLDEKNITMKLESSQAGFRGLSHYEWGNLSTAQAFLIETPNLGQYPEDGEVDQLAHPVYPLWKRVAVHIEVIRAILATFAADSWPELTGTDLLPSDPGHGLPDYAALAAEGLESWY